MRRAGTYSVGRRKTAVARAYLKAGKGLVVVNGESYEKYFPRETSQMVIRQPLELIEGVDSIDIFVNVNGGGKSGQAGAVRHAIARLLVKVDEARRPVIKAAGLLTRDPRMVERKKYGHHKARRRPQFSKR